MAKYTEITEYGARITDSDHVSLESMKRSVREFGGCIINDNNEFVYGSEWVYEEFIK